MSKRLSQKTKVHSKTNCVVCMDNRKDLYTCSRCGGCYQCEHTWDYDSDWICKDKIKRPVIQE